MRENPTANHTQIYVDDSSVLALAAWKDNEVVYWPFQIGHQKPGVVVVNICLLWKNCQDRAFSTCKQTFINNVRSYWILQLDANKIR